MTTTVISVKSLRPPPASQKHCGNKVHDGDIDSLGKFERPALSMQSRLLRLDVSGTNMSINASILARFPDSALYQISEDGTVPAELEDTVLIQPNGVIYVDANPQLLMVILDTYRYGAMHPGQICASLTKKELERWGLSDSLRASCCSTSYESSIGDVDSINKVIRQMRDLKGEPLGEDASRSSKLKRSIWLFMDFPSSSRPAMVYSILSIIFSLLMVGVSIMWSWPSSWIDTVETTVGNVTTRSTTFSRLGRTGAWYDCIYSYFLLIELIIRIIVCPSKRAFFLQFTTICDLIAIPAACIAYGYAIVEWVIPDFTPQTFDWPIHMCITLSNFRVFRLLYLSRIFPNIRVLQLALYASFKELILLISFILIFVIIFGEMMYFAESLSSRTFDSSIRAMWWAVVTMTTVGYGDFYPTTYQGYLVAVITAFCGMIIIVMPIPIVANNFYLFYGFFQDRPHLIT